MSRRAQRRQIYGEMAVLSCVFLVGLAFPRRLGGVAVCAFSDLSGFEQIDVSRVSEVVSASQPPFMAAGQLRGRHNMVETGDGSSASLGHTG